MFKNLRTGTKLFVLCAAFIIAIGVTAYQLVAEKQIAIDFARKELVGNEYLITLRETYAAILGRIDGVGPNPAADHILGALAAAQAKAGTLPGTAEFADAFAAVLRRGWASNADIQNVDTPTLDMLASAQALASRIGDDSNLALDPDLDTYYLQDIVVTRLPIFLGQLGELQTLVRAGPDGSSGQRRVRMLILAGLLRSTMQAVTGNLAAAYRGNLDGRLRRTVETAFAAMTSSTTAYLDRLPAGAADGAVKSIDGAAAGRAYASVLEGAINAWTIGQSELDRLLHRRIDGFRGRLAGSLALVGALAAFSIFLAFLTHERIARPLERLETIAKTVRETKNYGLRMDHSSQDEIGRLSIAFNDMLSELAQARQREKSEQSELARVARLTTAGAMTASIAHEINQPLTAIVASANAALRWLANPVPDLDETRASLRRIVGAGHRASEVIASVRAMFKQGGHASQKFDLNDLIREVLALVHDELQNRQISASAELSPELPQVVADRVLLQQVFLNLILNAKEAMSSVEGRARLLLVKSAPHGSDGVLITVQDSGTGIDPNHADRIFDAFFTTKPNGMGMGLAICRSIVESHNGRLWASAATPYGTIFHVVLPIGGVDGAS
jgi:signal transduction histidine kinase